MRSWEHGSSLDPLSDAMLLRRLAAVISLGEAEPFCTAASNGLGGTNLGCWRGEVLNNLRTSEELVKLLLRCFSSPGEF